MAAVERGMQSTPKDHIHVRREQDASTIRFGTVNGGQRTPPQTTSFRPEPSTSPVEYHQHTLPKLYPPLRPSSAAQEHPRPAFDSGRRSPTDGSEHHPAARRSTETHSSIASGKRKRSIEAGNQAAPRSDDDDDESSAEQQEYQRPASAQGALAKRPRYSADQSLRIRQDQDVGQSGRTEQQDDRDSAESRPHEGQDDLPPDSEANSQSPQDMVDPEKDKQRLAQLVDEQLVILKRTTGRKRMFAQRTKTGCHTCRRRKKKCDEAKPACTNCQRANVTCGGYGPRPEPDRSRVIRHLPIAPHQTQNLMIPVQMREQPPEPQWSGGPSQFGSNANHVGNPLHGQDGAFPHPAWNRPPVPPAPEERYQMRGGPQATLSNVPHESPSVPFQRFAAYPGPRGRSAPDSAPYGFHPSATTPVAGGQPSAMTDKEKMLSGYPYRHYIDPQLLNERFECQVALERFNRMSEPWIASSKDERGRLFRAIIQPQRYLDMGGDPEYPIGSIGTRVIVNSPFTCEYGYNIHIGNDVVIEDGCTIVDPCKVTIGDRTIIGCNVKLYGRTGPMDPKIRDGSQGYSLGGTITIEPDCFIGADVIVLPYRTIRQGAYVGAGTVVSKDIPPNTVVAGNPMRVIRGIGPNPDDRHKATIQAENEAAIAAARTERETIFHNKRLSRGGR